MNDITFLAEVRPNGHFVEFAPWYVIVIVGVIVFGLGVAFAFGKEDQDKQAQRGLRGVGIVLMIGGWALIIWGIFT